MRQQSHFRLPILLVPIRAANSTHLPFHGKLPNNLSFPIRYKFPLIFLKKLRFGQILSWHTSHYIFLCLMIHISERLLCIYFILAKNFFHLQVAYLKFLIPAFNIIFLLSFQYPPINSIDQAFIILKPPFMNFIFFAPQIIYSYHFSNLLLFSQ